MVLATCGSDSSAEEKKAKTKRRRHHTSVRTIPREASHAIDWEEELQKRQR
jgi:hypothetical protein